MPVKNGRRAPLVARAVASASSRVSGCGSSGLWVQSAMSLQSSVSGRKYMEPLLVLVRAPNWVSPL